MPRIRCPCCARSRGGRGYRSRRRHRPQLGDLRLVRTATVDRGSRSAGGYPSPAGTRIFLAASSMSPVTWMHSSRVGTMIRARGVVSRHGSGVVGVRERCSSGTPNPKRLAHAGAGLADEVVAGHRQREASVPGWRRCGLAVLDQHVDAICGSTPSSANVGGTCQFVDDGRRTSSFPCLRASVLRAGVLRGGHIRLEPFGIASARTHLLSCGRIVPVSHTARGGTAVPGDPRPALPAPNDRRVRARGDPGDRDCAQVVRAQVRCRDRLGRSASELPGRRVESPMNQNHEPRTADSRADEHDDRR